MLTRKRLKEKGKIKPSSIFREFKIGEKVAFVRNLSHQRSFPKQFQGLTGEIKGKMGRAYIVRFLNGKQHKELVVNTLHLKKFNLKTSKINPIPQQNKK